MQWLLDTSAWVLPVIFAITLHEAAHGWMAERFGDNTARILGRITANPFKHIDRMGTVILPALLLLSQSPVVFGYAKPVPVNFHLLTPPRLGMFMVAIAGVTVNFILAVITGLFLHIETWVTPEQMPWLFQNLYHSLLINCVLIVFNLIPILPLDGGRVVDSLLTGEVRRYYRKIERYGVYIVLGGLLASMLLGWEEIINTILGVPTFWLLEQVLWLTGNLK